MKKFISIFVIISLFCLSLSGQTDPETFPATTPTGSEYVYSQTGGTVMKFLLSDIAGLAVNFANSNLTFTGNRNHDLSSFNLQIAKGSTAFQVGDGMGIGNAVDEAIFLSKEDGAINTSIGVGDLSGFGQNPNTALIFCGNPAGENASIFADPNNIRITNNQDSKLTFYKNSLLGSNSELFLLEANTTGNRNISFDAATAPVVSANVRLIDTNANTELGKVSVSEDNTELISASSVFTLTNAKEITTNSIPVYSTMADAILNFPFLLSGQIISVEDPSGFRRLYQKP